MLRQFLVKFSSTIFSENCTFRVHKNTPRSSLIIKCRSTKLSNKFPHKRGKNLAPIWDSIKRYPIEVN